MQNSQLLASRLYHYRTQELWPRLFSFLFILFSVLSVAYLGEQVSAQETGASNPIIINSPPPQNPPPSQNAPPSYNSPPSQNAPPSYNSPPSQNAPPSYNSPPSQNAPPSYNSPPSQNAPPSSDPQTSASQAKYPALQISSPLILAVVIAAIAGIGGTLYVISRRYVMAE
jgi:hypothetical protein